MLSDVDFFLMSVTISFSLFKKVCLYCEEYFSILRVHNGHNLFSLATLSI